MRTVRRFLVDESAAAFIDFEIFVAGLAVVSRRDCLLKVFAIIARKRYSPKGLRVRIFSAHTSNRRNSGRPSDEGFAACRSNTVCRRSNEHRRCGTKLFVVCLLHRRPRELRVYDFGTVHAGNPRQTCTLQSECADCSARRHPRQTTASTATPKLKRRASDRCRLPCNVNAPNTRRLRPSRISSPMLLRERTNFAAKL